LYTVQKVLNETAVAPVVWKSGRLFKKVHKRTSDVVDFFVNRATL
jgi:hypothetical protein